MTTTPYTTGRIDDRGEARMDHAASVREPLPLTLEVVPGSVLKVLLVIIAGLLAMGLLLPS